MDTTRTHTKTFEFVMNIKEKKISLPEYIIFKKSFLEGLQVTKEWLKNIEKNDPTFKDIIERVLRNINFESLEYEMGLIESLKNEETEDLFNFLDSQIVPRGGVTTKTTTLKPKVIKSKEDLKRNIISKEDLKNEINELYKQQDNYDLCLNKTAELLQHPDLTDEEKVRYTNFYHELVEWINLKTKKQEEASKGSKSSTTISESRATSISVLRSSMLKELQKLRDMYIDPDE